MWWCIIWWHAYLSKILLSYLKLVNTICKMDCLVASLILDTRTSHNNIFFIYFVLTKLSKELRPTYFALSLERPTGLFSESPILESKSHLTFVYYLSRFISWQLAQGVQGIPDSTMQYANDNALQLAKVKKKIATCWLQVRWDFRFYSTLQLTFPITFSLTQSLKVALLVLGYTSTGLSLFTALVLLLLAQQINSDNKSE